MSGIAKLGIWAVSVLISWLLVAAVVCAIGAMLGCSTVPPGVLDAITNAIQADVGGSTPTTGPTTTTTTTVPPATGGDAVQMSALRWNRGGQNHSGAVRDPAVTITSATISRNELRYSGTGLTVWPVSSEGGNINAVISIFFDDDRDGVYERGGKFDWARSNAAIRPLGHVDHGYSNWDGYPTDGTPWAVVWTTERGEKRSNVVAGKWVSRRWWRVWE